MGKPRDGKEVKRQASIRIEPWILKRIISIYGSFSKFVNRKIKNDKKLKTFKKQ